MDVAPQVRKGNREPDTGREKRKSGKHSYEIGGGAHHFGDGIDAGSFKGDPG